MIRKLLSALFVVLLMRARIVYANDLPAVIPSPQTFVFDNQPVRVSAVYSQGYNYIKLDDLLKALDIDAALDQPNKTIVLDKTKPYSGLRPINGSTEQACRVIGGLEKLPKATPPVADEYYVMYMMTAANIIRRNSA